MATSKTTEFEEYIKGLLECPVCMKPIKLAPIHQCTNGHVVCKDCIPKCNNCPICRNNSAISRNLIFEQIVEKFSAFELAKRSKMGKRICQWGWCTFFKWAHKQWDIGSRYSTSRCHEFRYDRGEYCSFSNDYFKVLGNVHKRCPILGGWGVKNCPKKSVIISVCSLKVNTWH